jgi:hypothetical protein
MLPIAIRDTGFLNGQFSTRTCFNMWDGDGSGNFGWLNWSLQSPPQGDYTYSCQDEYLFSLGYEGNLPDDCSAQCLDINMDPQWCNRVDAMDIEVGDYVGGEPGVMDARYIRDWLEHYILEEIRAKIVVYDDIKGQGGCGKLENRNGIRYRVAGFACFYITGFRLSRGTGQEVRCDLLQDGTTLECGEITGGPYYADPSTCTNYPGDCVRANGDPCDWEPSEYNRITGYIIPCAGGDVGKCHAVGNLLAPMLSK